MTGAREVSRLARGLRGTQTSLRASPSCARGLTSSAATRRQASNTSDAFAELDSASSFAAPFPDDKITEAFKAARRPESDGSGPGKPAGLPGNRYQYRPPKYYRGPLHPVQMPPSSDPTARDFVPGPFSFPRLRHTYDSTIAPDLMTLTYTHTPPGAIPTESKKGELREWDGSSPYHKNRPRRGPRGGQSSRLGLIEREITFNNIPEIEAVTINTFAPQATQNDEYLHVARAVLQAITGEFPYVTKTKSHVQAWKVKKGDRTGAKVTLTGGAAHEFVDKLITLVLPKIKDWPGINVTTGDGSGNLAFGMKPDWMPFFPEIEFNYDMYPPRLVPGCDVFIKTSGTSDRQGRLLLEALGFPFYGKARY